MTTTSHLGIDLLVPHQAQKELTVNEALLCLDAVLHSAVIAVGQDTPPASPEPGEAYLLGAAPTGLWQGYPHHFAFYHAGWRFIPPRLTAFYYVQQTQCWHQWDGATWGKMLIKNTIGESS